jgi:hypothetical protein
MNPEATPEPAIHVEDFGANLAGLFLKSIERISEIQKQAIDFATQQNADTVSVLKKMTAKVPGASNLPVFDLTTETVSRFADTQKSAINFVVEQSRVWTETLKDRTRFGKNVAESNIKTAKQTLERSFALNKKALENSATQAKAVVDATKQQFGLSGTPLDAVTDTFKKSIDTIIDAQKEVMDLVAQ